ncbi:MAG: hypothetical protein ACM3ZQ_05775 [Bacillota bacterium]
MASLFRLCPRCAEPLSIDLITEEMIYYICLRCDGAWRLPPSPRWVRLRSLTAGLPTAVDMQTNASADMS